MPTPSLRRTIQAPFVGEHADQRFTHLAMFNQKLATGLSSKTPSDLYPRLAPNPPSFLIQLTGRGAKVVDSPILLIRTAAWD